MGLETKTQDQPEEEIKIPEVVLDRKEGGHQFSANKTFCL